ncbi:hypothetical protein AG4045_000096 [Apium graveolens]|uniref:Uncharacterized protein n=1 Tax=Apium graveolens TaxID=4045 RepID=A0A6L5B7L8_APIGR|nr:hypothetical protein AG4045_000096 [Apium graveolens]
MAWNVFKFCTALRGLGSIMIFFDQWWSDSLVALVVLLLFHGLLVMLLWSYFSVVLTDPGGVPLNWKPVVDEENGDADLLDGSEFSQLAGEPTTWVFDTAGSATS